MIHAYDKLYLSVAQKNLACMLDYMVNDLKRPLETVWQWFCMSNTASRFERGDCSVVAGMSGVEIAYEVLQEAGEPKPEQAPSYSYDRSPEYWTGWALAYYQWSTSLSFAEINQAIPVTEVASPEQFDVIRTYTRKKVREIGEGIFSGNVKISPYQRDGATACAYCEYQGICGFDQKIQGYEYRKLKGMDTELLMKAMQEITQSDQKE